MRMMRSRAFMGADRAWTRGILPARRGFFGVSLRARVVLPQGCRGFPGESRHRAGCIPRWPGHRTRIDRSPRARACVRVLVTKLAPLRARVVVSLGGSPRALHGKAKRGFSLCRYGSPASFRAPSPPATLREPTAPRGAGRFSRLGIGEGQKAPSQVRLAWSKKMAARRLPRGRRAHSKINRASRRHAPCPMCSMMNPTT